MSTGIDWPDGKRAALTISFDDGYADTYHETSKWLAGRGVEATYFVVSRFVGKNFEGIPTASWEDWQFAAAQGHEIASHSATHASPASPLFVIRSILGGLLVAPDKAAQVRQLFLRFHALRKYSKTNVNRQNKIDPLFEPQLSRQEIQQQLPQNSIRSYSYPAGRVNLEVRNAVINSGYQSARGNQAGINNGKNSIFDLRNICIGPGLSLPELEPWLVHVIDQGGWLIITFHLVSKNNYQYPYHCYVPDFKHIVNRIEKLPIWVASQQKVATYLEMMNPSLWTQ